MMTTAELVRQAELAGFTHEWASDCVARYGRKVLAAATLGVRDYAIARGTIRDFLAACVAPEDLAIFVSAWSKHWKCPK